jgi:putative holliday junction resolvase
MSGWRRVIIGRILCVDYGTRRIGLAVSDTEQVICSPANVLDGTGSPAKDAARVAEWASQNAAGGIVVGQPLHMDGGAGPQAHLTQKFVEQLRARTSLPVEMWDERLSSFQADQWMDDAGVPAKARAKRRDALAATAILRSFIESRKPRE